MCVAGYDAARAAIVNVVILQRYREQNAEDPTQYRELVEKAERLGLR